MNWSPDGDWLLYNSGGRLFKLPADGRGTPEAIDTDPALHANNDHVLPPDGRIIYCSADDGHLYAVPWEGGAARRVSNQYPAGTPGHPANRDVRLRLMQPDGGHSTDLVALLGGQGTINVNSWAPDSRRLAYVAYPALDE